MLLFTNAGDIPAKSRFYEQVTSVKWFLFFLHSVMAFAVVCCGCSALLFSTVFLFAL